MERLDIWLNISWTWQQFAVQQEADTFCFLTLKGVNTILS